MWGPCLTYNPFFSVSGIDSSVKAGNTKEDNMIKIK